MFIPIIDFRPARVVRGKETYVTYYVTDPTTDKLKRMRIRCNHVRCPRERVKFANILCAEINRKLYSGWNPLTGEKPAEKRNRILCQAVRDFCALRSRNLRPDSQRSYRSKSKQFREWCERRGVDDWLCNRFTAQLASEFLRDYEKGGSRSAYSYNDMLRFVKSMFADFVTWGMARENPFVSFKPHPIERKRRTTIPRRDRQRIRDYFIRKKMPEYITPMKLCCRYLLRPKEIMMLRLGDIDFEKGLLCLPPEVSKNHRERIIAIGSDVMRYFKGLRMQGLAPDVYIFSTDFKPGERLYTTKNLFSEWKKMRETLDMPDSYHFYSLKDTGITEMLESGMPSKYVKDLAGHTSLAMTERYMHTSDAVKILKANKVQF